RTTKSTTNFQTTPQISGSKIESGELELAPFYGSNRPPLFHKQRVTVWVFATRLARSASRSSNGPKSGPLASGVDPRISAVDGDQQPGRLMILWGVPGTGKSTFARWL